MLYKLPQLLIQVPAWASPELIHWQPGSTSPTMSVLLVPSVTSASRRTTAEKAKIPETRRLSIGLVSPKRAFPPGITCSKTLNGWQIDKLSPSTFCDPREPP